MKKLIIAAFGAILFAASCKNSNELNITGKVENPGEVKKILLYEADSLVDSAFLNEESEFKFRRVAPDANFYTLVIGEKNFLIIGKNGEEIDLRTNYTDTTNTYSIEGSDESIKVQTINTIQADFGKKYQELQQRYASEVSRDMSKKDSVYNALMPEFQANMDKYSETVFKFVEDNKDNLAAFYAAGTIDQNKYELELLKYAEEIKTKFPKNKAVMLFVAKMDGLKPVSVGQQAPDFVLNNPEGIPIKLSEYKGKYVLLDFWASWCGPCRDENPNIVKQHKAFVAKGFDVLGVSLDDNKGDWMKAIASDNLNWKHVSDLKRWDSKIAALYKVEGIPASFMLDRSGKIVAKNLRGVELEKFLAETLK
ncbi:TlpA disulfide reductase family protein [Daejeonella sp.]|uniref:peroxiredoxin family protein n=1 Tax=Daejeonella sp. TaxID=2805397 RepID=UPI0030C37DD3